jgi:hypothetical protein
VLCKKGLITLLSYGPTGKKRKEEKKRKKGVNCPLVGIIVNSIESDVN